MDLDSFKINDVDFTSINSENSEAIMDEDKFFELFNYAKGLERDCAKAVEMRMETVEENAKLLIDSKLVEEKISNRIQELYSSIELLDHNNDDYDYGRIDGAIEELKNINI
ncbi:MAG: hypothetical protein GY799_34670 [Desulfobulbaceae bacterium]|jgi:K+/H+ antiporter YhaU regulatory subunit KhtT|nr:hypothetical protein [Desulfobulbaceae bacterium]